MQDGCLRRPHKWLRKEEKLKAMEKRKDILWNAAFQRIARRDNKAFLNDQYKEIEEKIKWERLGITSRKLDIPREPFIQKWAQ